VDPPIIPRQDVVKAFLRGERATSLNTRSDGKKLYLHHTCIAWRDELGDVHLTMAGWTTTLTRDRLNEVCAQLIGKRPFVQIGGKQFFGKYPVRGHQIITIHKLDGAT
jgi:hypothetical protein